METVVRPKRVQPMLFVGDGRKAVESTGETNRPFSLLRHLKPLGSVYRTVVYITRKRNKDERWLMRFEMLRLSLPPFAGQSSWWTHNHPGQFLKGSQPIH